MSGLIGQMLGKVRIEERLGEGAIGVVYRGRHTTLDIDVAVKVLKLEHNRSNDQYYRERFRREAQTAAKLDHPNLVKVHDFGQHDNLPYIVMDLVDGPSLAEYLRRRSLSEQTILKVLMVVADVLGVAHAAGIIHRDLKPANILITHTGQLKVVDLGLVRADGMATLTMEQMIVGSPAYMAPESFSPQGKVDQRSDIYALGVIGYQMVFRTLPYDGSVAQIIHGHLRGQTPFDLPTSCDPTTIALVQRMMALDPAARPQSARAVVHEVRRLLRARHVTPPPVGAASQAVSPAASVSPAEMPQELRSGELSGFFRFLEQHAGTTTSELAGSQIVHATAHERIIVWILSAGVVALVLLGHFVFGR
jgi:eukaryotic-like serine/threonine-protein kinase